MAAFFIQNSLPYYGLFTQQRNIVQANRVSFILKYVEVLKLRKICTSSFDLFFAHNKDCGCYLPWLLFREESIPSQYEWLQQANLFQSSYRHLTVVLKHTWKMVNQSFKAYNWCSSVSCISNANVDEFVFQGKWPVHYGRTGLQFPLHNGRSGLYNPGPLQCTKHSQTQPLPVALHRLCQRTSQLLHGQSVHAHEAAVSLRPFPHKNFIFLLFSHQSVSATLAQ